MFSHIAQEIQKTKILEPIVVIHHPGRVRFAVEIQKFPQLAFQFAGVGIDCFFALKGPFRRLSRGVANSTCSSTYQNHRGMAMPLEMDQSHHGNQIPNA